MCTEGEIGAGKSSSNNYFIYEYSQMKGGLQYQDKTFKFGRQCERVTTQVNTSKIGELTVMDTPGTNDIKSELSDYDINKMKHEALAMVFADPQKGVSCITQCIMIDAGGRIKETAIESMARTFHSLTYSYP